MAEREPEDYKLRANRRAELHSQGVKGMFLLNGGGILALLTFQTQLLLADDDFSTLSKSITIAICFLVIGLVLLAPINHIRYESSRSYDKDETKARGKALGRVHKVFFCLSLVLFTIGLFVALRGLWLTHN